ncbi:LytR family transcriptional regulator [Alloscardovia theropitheci]|uniref:LytR family transcriptional regulator n=1 Tax=Alloscardovia theropitheci TaxID=2496842 RepID=A0A4R0QN94_9BIFI|nr:LytR C-terminal domain-containing protein [Alloscardovia theropitheci]TCD53624.1 LytR family transcriptional regulator [Alloscardovia theropitheci]
MVSSHSDYPRDEFDHITGGNGGAHRGSKTILARIMPYIIAIVVAAVLAGIFLTWTNGWLGRNGLNLFPSTSSTTTQQSNGSTQSSQSSKKTDSQSNSSNGSSQSSSDSTSSSASNSSSETQQTAAQPDKSRSVYVFNATGINGYAADRASVLTNAGYSSVTPTNPSTGNLPSENTVWYVNDGDQTTAQDVASQLGISNVQKVNGLNQGDIAVILVSQ